MGSLLLMSGLRLNAGRRGSGGMPRRHVEQALVLGTMGAIAVEACEVVDGGPRAPCRECGMLRMFMIVLSRSWFGGRAGREESRHE